jgi:HEAT repeat protein
VALADATAEEALPALLESVRSARPRLRQMALLAIGEVAPPGDAAACEAVGAGLASDAPAIRFQALVAANRLLPAAALVAPLRSALAADEPRLRYLACRIVEERFLSEPAPAPNRAPEPGDDAERLAALVDGCLDDADADVALAAALALARRGSRRASACLARALNARRRFTHLDDEHAAVDLCGQLGVSAARPGLRAHACGPREEHVRDKGVLSGPQPRAFAN